MFGSFGAGFGSFGSGVGGLFPSLTYLISWLKAPTADGKTLANSKGVDADLTDVNCLQFDGNVNKRVDINSAGGVDLTANTQTNLGSCVITSTFIQEGLTTDPQVIYACGAATYRLLIIDGYFHVNNLTADSYRIFAVELNKLYRTTLTYSATGAVTSFVLENLTDGTTQTDTTFRVHSNHGGTHGFQIGARTNGFNFNGKISNVSVTNSSKGAGFHLPLAEGSGTKAYDISGNNGHGIITGAAWSTLDGIESWNHEYGHDLVGVLNGTVSGFDTGIGGDELDMYEIKMQSTSDAGGDGNSFFVGIGSGSSNPTLFMTNTVGGDGRKISYYLASAGYLGSLGSANSAQFNTYKVDYTNTSSVKVFVNGELKLTSTQTVIPTTNHFYIGGDSPSSASDNGFFYYFKGWKDGVLKIHAVTDSSGRVKDLVSGNLLTAAVGGTGSLGVKRIPALNTKTKQVATFDGVDDYVVTEPVTLGNNFEFEWTGSLSDAEYFGRIIANKNSTTNEGVFEFFRNGFANSLRFTIYPNGGSRQESAYINFNFDGSVKTHKVTYNNGTLTYLVDDVTLYSNTFSSGNGFTGSDAFGIYSRPNGSNNCAGTLQNFKLTISGSTAFEYDFQSDIGTTTIQDLSTNDNDGTVIVGASGLATFWGTRVADASGSLVSADYATGNTSISNPAGFVHNNSECGVKLQSRTVGTFDGGDDRVDFNHNLVDQQDFVVEWEGIMGAVSNNDAFWSLFDDSGSNRGSYIRYEHTNTKIFARIGNQSINSSSITLAENDVIKLTTTISNSGTKASAVIVVNGVTTNLFTNQSLNTAPEFDGTGRIGRLTPLSTSQFKGKVSSFKITQGGVTEVEYDFSEGQGTTLTDLSGNGNNGTIVVGASGTETFWADSYQEYKKIDLDQGFVPAQLTVTDCTDTSLNGLYYLDSTRNNDKLRWLKNNNTAQKVYFNSGSNRWTIQDSGGSVTKVGDTILPAEGSYGNGANLAYSTQGVFIKTSGTNITQIGQYDGDEILTATEATRNDRYFG